MLKGILTKFISLCISSDFDFQPCKREKYGSEVVQ